MPVVSSEFLEIVSSPRHKTKGSRGRPLGQELEVEVEAMGQASRAQEKLLDQKLEVEVEAMEQASWNLATTKTGVST